MRCGQGNVKCILGRLPRNRTNVEQGPRDLRGQGGDFQKRQGSEECQASRRRGAITRSGLANDQEPRRIDTENVPMEEQERTRRGRR